EPSPAGGPPAAAPAAARPAGARTTGTRRRRTPPRRPPSGPRRRAPAWPSASRLALPRDVAEAPPGPAEGGAGDVGELAAQPRHLGLDRAGGGRRLLVEPVLDGVLREDPPLVREEQRQQVELVRGQLEQPPVDGAGAVDEGQA